MIPADEDRISEIRKRNEKERDEVQDMSSPFMIDTYDGAIRRRCQIRISEFG